MSRRRPKKRPYKVNAPSKQDKAHTPTPIGSSSTMEAPRGVWISDRVLFRILVPAIFAVFALIVTAVVFSTGSPHFKGTSPDSGVASQSADRSPQQAEETVRQRRLSWWGKPYLSVRPEHEVRRFESYLHQLKATSPPAFIPNILLQSTEAQRRIRKAARTAVDGVWPVQMWRPDEVRQIVSEIGGTRPVFQDDLEGRSLDPALMGPDMIMGFAYYITADRFVSDERSIMNTSERELPAVLVHEATHLVYARWYYALSGFEPREVSVLQSHCSDFGIVYRVLHEALAYRNELLWYAAQPGGETTDSKHTADMYRMAVGAERGQHATLLEYTRYLLAYAEAKISPNERRSSLTRTDCGPPPMLRGNDRGKIVLPSDVAPEILIPFLDALAREP